MYREQVEAMNAEVLNEIETMNSAEEFWPALAREIDENEEDPAGMALQGALSVFEFVPRPVQLDRKGILALANEALIPENLPLHAPTHTALQIATIERVRLFADTIRGRLRAILEKTPHFDAVAAEAESIGVELKFVGGGEKWEGEDVYGHSARWRELQLELKAAKVRASEIVATAQRHIESHEMAMKQRALANRIGQEIVSYDENGEEIPMAKSKTESPTLRITLK